MSTQTQDAPPATGPARASRRALLKTHKAHLKRQELDLQAGSVPARQIKQPLMQEAYPASTKSIRELELIPLSALEVEKRHAGKGVVVRTISAPYHGAGIVCIVEDSAGNADKLTIHNHTDTSVLANVPEGCVLAVKEPYYRRNGGGGGGGGRGHGDDNDFVVCVDHPSDVVLLRFNDPLIPPSLRLRPDQPIFKQPGEWRAVGDKAFLERDLPTAIFCYTEALELLKDEDAETAAARRDVLSKRAGTSLMLGCFDAAKADALASCNGSPSDWKAYFTAGRAAYGLWRYAECKGYLDRALERNPGAAAVRKERARCLARLEEENSGSHDFQSLFATLSPQHVHMDAASYLAKTVIRASAHHGRGVFAAQDIAAGELLFCEKAAQMPNQYDPARASAALYAKMAHQLFDNPSLAPKVLALHGGDYARSGLEGTMVDGVPVVDVFLLEAIRTKNCFSSPPSTLEETRPETPGGRFAKGLWPHASHMNHGCAANTHRAFLGDLLLARATRPIRAGEELLQNYISIQPLRALRQRRFAEWGFQCRCALCAGEEEAEAEAEDEARRTELLLQVEKLAAKRPPGRHVPDAVIRSMERLHRQLEQLHGDDDGNGPFARLPRLMLVSSTMWLLAAHRTRRHHAKVVEYARAALRNFGYRYGAAEGVDVRRCWEEAGDGSAVLMSIHVVTALRDGSEALAALGKEERARQWMEASCFGYRIVNGFEEDVGLLETRPRGRGEEEADKKKKKKGAVAAATAAANGTAEGEEAKEGA